MIEAQIICSLPCDVRDLGLLDLQRGEEVWIDDEAASRSVDLWVEQRKGTLRVYRRSQRMSDAPRRPSPPFVARSRPPAGSRPPKVSAPPKGPPATPTSKPEVAHPSPSADEIAIQVKEKVLEDLLPSLRELASALAMDRGASVPVDEIEGMIERVLRRVAPGVPAPRGEAPRADGEPLFVPSVLTGDSRGVLSVKTETSTETSDIDDAQETLRALRRGSRTKERP